MGTRITFHMDYVKNHESIVIDHVDSGHVQVFDQDMAAGGSERPFLIHYAVIEPLPDDLTELPPPAVSRRVPVHEDV